MQRTPQNKTNSTITGIAVALFVMLAASGNILVALMLILPIVFFLIVFLSIKKSKQQYGEEVSFEELRRGVYTAAGDLGQELRRAKEYFEQEILTEEETRTSRTAPAQRAHTERKQAVNEAMLDKSEREYLQNLSGSNPLAGYELELRDLLNAGIIERDEYNDRMRELRTTRR